MWRVPAPGADGAPPRAARRASAGSGARGDERDDSPLDGCGWHVRSAGLAHGRVRGPPAEDRRELHLFGKRVSVRRRPAAAGSARVRPLLDRAVGAVDLEGDLVWSRSPAGPRAGVRHLAHFSAGRYDCARAGGNRLGGRPRSYVTVPKLARSTILVIGRLQSTADSGRT